MNSDQRVKAERAWLGDATAWARAHPEANAAAVIAAVPNPHNLLVRPLAGAAVTMAGRELTGLLDQLDALKGAAR